MTFWFRIAFWLAAALSFGLAVNPQPLQLPHTQSDKVLHVLAFATLAVLAALAYPATSRLKLVALLSLFGAAIELAQLFPPLNRDGDPVDWIADTVSAALAMALMSLWRGRRSPSEQ